jgi:RpiR family carbohydrate utilization transcriptional regulator
MNESNIDRVPRSVLIKIRALYDTLKSAERRLVDHLLENPLQVKDSTIVELARRAGCSEATIVRLSKRLGFEGFPELKAAFGSEEGHARRFEYEGILATDDCVTVVGKVFDATRDALNDTLDLVVRDHYERAVEALLGASKIVFAGLGDAGLVAMEACQRFLRIGENCFVSEDPDVQLIMAEHLQKGDVFFPISHTGRSKPILEAMKRARNAGATVILITNYPVSPLAKHADIVLLTAAFSRHLTGEVISKRVAELCIIESLYISYLIGKGDAALERLSRSNEAVKIHKL